MNEFLWATAFSHTSMTFWFSPTLSLDTGLSYSVCSRAVFLLVDKCMFPVGKWSGPTRRLRLPYDELQQNILDSGPLFCPGSNILSTPTPVLPLVSLHETKVICPLSNSTFRGAPRSGRPPAPRSNCRKTPWRGKQIHTGVLARDTSLASWCSFSHDIFHSALCHASLPPGSSAHTRFPR